MGVFGCGPGSLLSALGGMERIGEARYRLSLGRSLSGAPEPSLNAWQPHLPFLSRLPIYLPGLQDFLVERGKDEL